LEENYRPDVLFVRTSARIRVYPADGFLPSADAVKTASARTQPSVRADAKKIKKKNFILFFLKFFFGIFSIFNFRFSIPKIPKIPKLPKLPELHGLRGRSREKKKKVFSA
jgi:hypothetical protein